MKNSAENKPTKSALQRFSKALKRNCYLAMYEAALNIHSTIQRRDALKWIKKKLKELDSDF